MTTLTQPNGPTAGQPWRPTPHQLQFLAWWYAVDEDGRWLYNHAARRLSKGTGKGPFSAVLALAEFVGPVRVKDFDPKRPGGAVGKPADFPLVVIAGVSETGALPIMRQVRAFATKKSAVVAQNGIDPGKWIYYKETGGELRVITSSAGSIEGAEITAAFVDETQLWFPNSPAGAELAATLEDNLAKSGSRMVETSNAWVPGLDSMAEITYEGWMAQEEGQMVDEAARILYDARIAPPDTDLADPQSLRRALEWVYDGCHWIDFEAIEGRIWSPRARVEDSTRKYLNRPTAAWNAWVEPEQWQALSKPDEVVEAGERVILFCDPSLNDDATAIIGCRMSDGHVFVVGIWEVTKGETTIDLDEVDRELMAAFARYDVVAFWSDVHPLESYVLSTWPQRWADDLKIWSAPSAKPPQAIGWDFRGHKREVAQAVEAAHGEIVTGALSHDGNSALTRHVSNARRRAYQQWVTIGKETANSPKKIDGAVAMVGARMLWRIAKAADTKTAKKPKRTGQLW